MAESSVPRGEIITTPYEANVNQHVRALGHAVTAWVDLHHPGTDVLMGRGDNGKAILYFEPPLQKGGTSALVDELGEDFPGIGIETVGETSGPDLDELGAGVGTAFDMADERGF